MKRITALTLIAALQLGLYTPVFAINENTQNESKTIVSAQKTKKEGRFFNKKKKEADFKIKTEYINTDWWNSFQDPYLDEYIARALQKKP